MEFSISRIPVLNITNLKEFPPPLFQCQQRTPPPPGQKKCLFWNVVKRTAQTIECTGGDSTPGPDF